MSYTIYQYRDPITQEIYYIGRSTNPESRLKQHATQTKSPCHAWLKSLKERGLQPIIEYLETGEDVVRSFFEKIGDRDYAVAYSLSGRRERYWIKKQKPLLNITHNEEARLAHGEEIRPQVGIWRVAREHNIPYAAAKIWVHMKKSFR